VHPPDEPPVPDDPPLPDEPPLELLQANPATAATNPSSTRALTTQEYTIDRSRSGRATSRRSDARERAQHRGASTLASARNISALRRASAERAGCSLACGRYDGLPLPSQV
jgi:hypothetical protein